MRNMVIRTASTGEVMVIVVFHADEREKIAALLDHLAAAFPEITSLFYVINEKVQRLHRRPGTPSATGARITSSSGWRGCSSRSAPSRSIRPIRRRRTNFTRSRATSPLTGKEILYDLYTGTGTIANFCAARCAKVVGVEYVPEAIEDAAQFDVNGIGNTVFYAGDMKAVLSDEFIRRNGRPDVIILDRRVPESMSR